MKIDLGGLWEGTSEKLEDRKYIKVIIDQEEIFDEKLQDGLVNVVDLKTESVKMSSMYLCKS